MYRNGKPAGELHNSSKSYYCYLLFPISKSTEVQQSSWSRSSQSTVGATLCGPHSTWECNSPKAGGRDIFPIALISRKLFQFWRGGDQVLSGFFAALISNLKIIQSSRTPMKIYLTARILQWKIFQRGRIWKWLIKRSPLTRLGCRFLYYYDFVVQFYRKRKNMCIHHRNSWKTLNELIEI